MNKTNQELFGQYNEGKEERIPYYHYSYYVTTEPFNSLDLKGRGKVLGCYFHKEGVCNHNGYHDNMPNHFHSVIEWDREYLATRMSSNKNPLTECMKKIVVARNGKTNRGVFKNREHFENHMRYIENYERIGCHEEEPVSDDEDAVSSVDVSTITGPDIKTTDDKSAVRAENQMRPKGVPRLKKDKQDDFYKTLLPNVPFCEKQEWFDAYSKYQEEQGLNIYSPHSEKVRNNSWAYIQGWRRNIEQAQYNKPLTMDDMFVMRRFDPYHDQNMKKVLRIMELIHHKLNKDKKTPIVWLCGAASAGKTVFARICGLALGKVANINGNTAWNDTLVLDTPARKNVDCIVMEEYNLDQDKDNTLTKQFQFLKQITTGQEHEVRTSKNSKDNDTSHYLKLRALIMCTNWGIDQTVATVGRDIGINNRSCIMNFPNAIKHEQRWDEKLAKRMEPLYVRLARKYLKDRTEGVIPDEGAQPPCFPRKYLEEHKNWPVAITGLPDLQREEQKENYDDSDDEDEYVEWRPESMDM